MRDKRALARRLWFGLSIITNFLVATALGCSFLWWGFGKVIWWGFGKVICDDYTSAMVPGPPDTPRYLNNIRLDRDYTAYVWSRNCGATTAYNTKVFLASPEPKWHDQGEAVFETRAAPEFLQLRWYSPTELIIEYPATQTVYTQKLVSKWYDVTITLRARTP